MLASGIFVLLAAGAYLDRPRTLLTPAGIVHGVSYTDDVVRLPALLVLTIVAGGSALAAAYAALSSTIWPVGAAAAAYMLVLVGGGGVAMLLQQLVVTPDEQAKERPYIEHNIKATRSAFDLDQVEERQVSGDATLTRADIENNAETINNVRLWDHQPLLDTFGQIQEIRTYYEFASVDNDRYVVDGEYRQTMLSARELNSASLPNRSWINERLQYTHGFGVAMGPVNEVTQEGLPVLFLRDLPPRSETNLSVDQPSLYFGELSNDYVLVNTNTDEFHYPEGDDNVSTRYDGTGGLELGNLFRRLLFSLKSRSYEMLVSGQLTRDSRVIYHRNISDRLTTIAPFLQFDADPYLVIVDGRLFWIRDAYTRTGNYPYSTPVAGGISYIRNSVKAVIDAYNGTTLEGGLRPEVGLLGDPVLVRLPRLDPRRAQPVVVQHLLEPHRQLAPAAALQLVRRRRQVVVSKHRRHRAQRPQRTLQAGHQRLERLAQRQRHIRPPAVAQYPLEQQVRERDPPNRHPQRARVREVERRFPARNRHLLEVHLAVRSVLRPPLADTPLQRPQLPHRKATRMPPAQPPEQRQRLQPSLRVGHQLRHYLRLPHVAERVLPRPPRPRRLRRRRQRPALPAARRPLAHACRRRGRRQRLPGHPFLPQSPNLRVCDQPVLRGKQAVSHAPRAVHEPADLSFPRPAKIIVVDQATHERPRSRLAGSVSIRAPARGRVIQGRALDGVSIRAPARGANPRPFQCP